MPGASYYDAAWQRLIPVAVDLTGDQAGATTADVQITIPDDHDEFWTLVQSNGVDIRVCSADGWTLETCQLGTWTDASRVAVIDVDNVSLQARQ